MSTPTFETIPLDLCTDCLMFLANGDEPEPLECPPWDEADNWPGISDSWEGWQMIAGGRCDHCEDEEDECESSFSHSRCDACHHHLGGDRYHGTAMREV